VVRLTLGEKGKPCYFFGLGPGSLHYKASFLALGLALAVTRSEFPKFEFLPHL